MGSCNFVQIEEGLSVRDAFETAVNDALCEYGEDSYNGTISTCRLCSCRKMADKYSKSVEEKAYKFVIDEEYGDGKRDAYALDLGVTEYIVRTVKKKTEPGSVRYKVCYKFENATIGIYSTKQKAEEEAEKYAIKKGVPVVVVKEDGSSVHYYIEEKTYKTKPNLKPMKNREIFEVHKYMFYGWAAC